MSPNETNVLLANYTCLSERFQVLRDNLSGRCMLSSFLLMDVM